MLDRRPLLLVALLAPLLVGRAHAEDQTKCLAAKNKCAAKKIAGLLRCFQKAQTPGKPADPNAKDCITKVMAKFDGGDDPSKGCFAKLEAKKNNDCQPPLDNTAAVEAVVDRCVDDVVAALTTAPPSSASLTFVMGPPAGTCGETRDDAGGVRSALACGGLSLGGGISLLGEGLLGAGAASRFTLACTGTSCAVGPTSTVPAAGSTGPDCTAAGCSFGVPVEFPNPAIPVLGICAVSRWNGPAAGTLDLASGAASIDAPLSVDIFLTGATYLGEPLCPRCSTGGSPGSPGIGTCGTGARAGQLCASTNPDGLTRDCPPTSDGFVGSIPIVAAPLATGTATSTSESGLFCPGQSDNVGCPNPDACLGCFGDAACRSIVVNGTPAGMLSAGIPRPATLASVFCVPATGNGAVDASTSLPGPGVVSLPGMLLVE